MFATSVPLYAAPTSPGVGKPVTVTVGASSSTSETRLLAPTRLKLSVEDWFRYRT